MYKLKYLCDGNFGHMYTNYVDIHRGEENINTRFNKLRKQNFIYMGINYLRWEKNAYIIINRIIISFI